MKLGLLGRGLIGSGGMGLLGVAAVTVLAVPKFRKKAMELGNAGLEFLTAKLNRQPVPVPAPATVAADALASAPRVGRRRPEANA